MPSPSSFALFALVNAITWPGFALAYWYYYQREEEKLLDAVTERPADEADDATVTSESKLGGDS